MRNEDTPYISELARALGCSRRSIYRWMKEYRGQLPQLQGRFCLHRPSLWREFMRERGLRGRRRLTKW